MVDIERNNDDDGNSSSETRWKKIRERMERMADNLGLGDVELPEGDEE